MIGLIFAFLLLGTALCYVVISTNINPVIKAVLIIATTWYSIALYATPGMIAGYPKMVDQIPNGALIMTAKIIEPYGDDPGGMYFWVIEKKKYEKKLSLSPIIAFREIHRIRPRAFELKYNRELHEKHAKAKKKQGEYGVMRYRKGKATVKDDSAGGNKKRKKSKVKSPFEIINPTDLLPPKD